MNKTFKKIAAYAVAITTLTIGMTSISAGAIDSNEQKMLEMLPDLSRSSTFYIPEYDSYDIYNLAPTKHYMAALPIYNTNLSNTFGTYFYINTNILSSSPTDSDLFSICTGYDGLASMGTISSSTYATNCKRILARVIKTGNPTSYSPLFSYYLEGVENNDAINNEYNLHQMSSASTTSPSSILYTNTGESMMKSVYALGDVDRDGDVDTDDADAIQKYNLGLYSTMSGRSTADAAYDEAVFNLAADFNEDDLVNLSDAVAIRMYISSNS